MTNQIETPETGRTIYPAATVPTSDLQVGDVVRQEPSGIAAPWDSCIVQKVFADRVELFRPYGHAASFSCGATDPRLPYGAPCGKSVICYTGIETYQVETARAISWFLYQRTGLK